MMDLTKVAQHHINVVKQKREDERKAIEAQIMALHKKLQKPVFELPDFVEVFIRILAKNEHVRDINLDLHELSALVNVKVLNSKCSFIILEHQHRENRFNIEYYKNTDSPVLTTKKIGLTCDDAKACLPMFFSELFRDHVKDNSTLLARERFGSARTEIPAVATTLQWGGNIWNVRFTPILEADVEGEVNDIEIDSYVFEMFCAESREYITFKCEQGKLTYTNLADKPSAEADLFKLVQDYLKSFSCNKNRDEDYTLGHFFDEPFYKVIKKIHFEGIYMDENWSGGYNWDPIVRPDEDDLY